MKPAQTGTDGPPSFWQASAPAFTGGREGRVEGDFDVAVIGAGFTGLSAALELAGSGASVVVLEAGFVVGAASGRNGGQCNSGTAHDFGALVDQYGLAKAREFYLAHCDAVDTVERIARDEGIECDFERCGRAKLAAKPAHYAKLEMAHDLLRQHVDPAVHLVPPDRIEEEIRAQGFHGALIQETSARLHPARFGRGMADASARKGAAIFENAPVENLVKASGGWQLDTPRGSARVRQVLVATGGASPQKPFKWFNRRIVSVGSFAIATKPLSTDLLDTLFPTRRNYVTSRIIGNYFRLTSDDRLIFGGRARFALSDPASDLKSGRILERTMRTMFPQLKDVEVDHCWGGTIDLTADRLPRAGEHEGLHFAMGYSGHGVQMATHMGQKMARAMGGETVANPFEGLPWPAIPGHIGKAWFLPIVGAYYRLQDMLQ